MFYHHDFLSRPSGGLGLIWVAATIGNKSSFRKLKDREIASVDVTEACASVARPKEPMALRLSSQLMFGVVRIYVQQTEQWISAVQNTHTMMRKVISDLSSKTTLHWSGDKKAGGGGTNDAGQGSSSAIDLPARGSAWQKTITLPINTYFFAGDFDWVGVWSVEEEERRREAAAATQRSSEGGIASDRYESSLLGDIGDYSGGDVSTTAGPLDDLLLDSASAAGIARAPRHTAEHSRITSRSHLWLRDDTGFGSELPGDTRLSALEAGTDDVGMEHHLDLELELPDEGLALAEDGATFQQSYDASSIFRRGLDLGQGRDMHLDDVPFDMGMDDFALDGEQIMQPGHRPREDDETAAGTRAEQPKTKKVKFAREDAMTELSNEVIRHASENYIVEMSVQNRAEQARRHVRIQEEAVRSIVFGPQWTGSMHCPDFADIWESTVGARLREKQEQTASMRSAFLTADTAAQDGGHDNRAIVARGEQRAFPLSSPLADREDNMFDQPFFDDEQNMLAYDAPPPGVGPFSSSPPMEVGRSGSGSGDKPVLPWTLPRDRGDTSIILGEDTRSVRSLTVEGPEGLRRVRRDGSLESDGPYSRRASVLSQAGGGGGGGETMTASQLIPSQILREEQESEKNNFFTYVEEIKLALPGDQPLFFSDVAPVADTAPGVAAQAFYHVLTLATSGAFQVKQSDPHGEIEIAIRKSGLADE